MENNWHINKSRVSQFTKDQQAMVREIFLKLHSPQYAEKVFAQVEHDGGFAKGSVGLFGKPGSGKFEFVYTGRHCTRRCDGDSVDGVAFGGPIFYGHAAGSFYEKAGHKGDASTASNARSPCWTSEAGVSAATRRSKPRDQPKDWKVCLSPI